jgi:hypothetical protein
MHHTDMLLFHIIKAKAIQSGATKELGELLSIHQRALAPRSLRYLLQRSSIIGTCFALGLVGTCISNLAEI